MKALTESMRAQIRAEWLAAVNGAKTRVIARWADVFGCSPQSLYRQLGVGRKRSGERKIAGLEDAAEIVAQIKKRPPKDAGEIATDQAVELAVANGCISEDLAGVSLGTWNRVMRECGLARKCRRVSRFQAEYPNQLHHVDASSSQYFYIHRQDGDDYVLRMHKGSALGYKNKPIKVDRLRPWLYGLTDDYSGYHIARYVAAAGESLADNLQFLAWAWAQNDDKPFFGIPDRLKADQGPLMKGEASREWLTRLDIELDGSRPYEKEAHGKIERPWRTLWGRFEKTFFAEDWKHYEITLSELNRRFRIYQDKEYNLRPHRFEREITRIDAWRRINLRGGAVAMPENAIGTAAKRHPRTVDQAGCISLDGQIYEVKGLHAAKVWVYEGIYEDKLVVEDMTTGEKYETRRFAPLPLDTYRAPKDTPHDRAAKAAEGLQLRNTLYEDRASSSPFSKGGRGDFEGKITCIPTRIKERRTITNPLDADAYSSIDQAMRDFMSICPVRLDAESRESIRDAIIESGLSRSYTQELALEIQAENARTDVG